MKNEIVEIDNMPTVTVSEVVQNLIGIGGLPWASCYHPVCSIRLPDGRIGRVKVTITAEENDTEK